MNEQRSARLEQLFAAADRELRDDAFVAAVMARTKAPATRHVAIYVTLCAVAVPVTWLAAGPLHDALSWFTELIAQPLAPAGGGIAGVATQPLNSVGGALVLMVFAARALARRLFSTGG